MFLTKFVRIMVETITLKSIQLRMKTWHCKPEVTLVKICHCNLFFVFCIKVEVSFGHKIYEKLNLSQYFLLLATIYTQAMYLKSFNTKILQSLAVNKIATHTTVIIVHTLAIIVFEYSYSETFELSFMPISIIASH